MAQLNDLFADTDRQAMLARAMFGPATTSCAVSWAGVEAGTAVADAHTGERATRSFDAESPLLAAPTSGRRFVLRRKPLSMRIAG
jgi:hypothetical protein